MKSLFLVLTTSLVLIGCGSAPPKVEPRTVWSNGYPIKENCLFADEHWSRILPAIGSDNIKHNTVHMSSGSYTTTRIDSQVYICNRSAFDIEASQRKR